MRASISPTDIPVYQRFSSLLPKRPYCADYVSEGLIVRSRAKALEFRHLQFNDPTEWRWLPFDVDLADAFDAYERSDLPAPNIFVSNPENGHAHLMWALAAPISLSPNSRQKPIRFAEAIERGIARRLGADRAYTGLIAKNPTHGHWRTSWIAPNAYTLDELAGWLTQDDMRFRPKTTVEMGFLGRNVAVFDAVRQHAYRDVREFKRNGATFHRFHMHVEAMAVSSNITFSSPLPQREIRATAKSIAKWTWARFSEARFVAVQSHRGIRSGEARKLKSQELQSAIMAYLHTPPSAPPIPPSKSASAPQVGLLSEMVRETITDTDEIRAVESEQSGIKRRVPSADEIAAVLGISRATAYRHLSVIRKGRCDGCGSSSSKSLVACVSAKNRRHQ